MPWCLMSRGGAAAQNSLLLNYVTSSTLVALIRSFQRKHFLVSIGICGSLILRLMIVFASGLLRLEYRSIAFGARLSVEDVFDLTKTVDYVPGLMQDMEAGLQYWAMLKYGLPYPHGLTSQFAVQSLLTGDNSKIRFKRLFNRYTARETDLVSGVYDDLMGEIQVFESSLENCESFKFTYNTQGSVDHLNYTLQKPMSAASPLSLRERLRNWCYFYSFPIWSDAVTDDPFISFLNTTEMIYKCKNSTLVEDQDHRILFTLDSWLSYSEFEVSGFTCEPRYSLTRRTVTNSTWNFGAQERLNISGAIIETLETGLNPIKMTKSIIDSLYGFITGHWNTWYTLVDLTQPQANGWSFRNTSLAIELSQRTWKGLAAYVIKHGYTFPSKETINGTATSIQGRLCIQELSLRLVEASVTLLLALIMVLFSLRPGVLHRDPTSLGAHSMIMARSPRLVDLLQGFGMSSKQALWASLSEYLASFPQNFSPKRPAVVLHQFQGVSDETNENPKMNNSDPHEWWSPVSVRWWFRISLMAATLAVVIALEALLQVSERRHGLGDVVLKGYLKYTWSLLPTVVLVLLGLLFSVVDSTARTIHPFQLLRKGRATIDDMFHDPARQVSLISVVEAARKRHFVLLWATLPGLLSPILTIISSGLYTVAPVPWTYDAELELKDWFQPENRTVYSNNTVEGDTGEAWDIFTLIQFSNMPYPQWTHGEFALASFGADNLHSHEGNNTSLYVTARVPATRVNLNCSLVGYYTNDTYPITLRPGLGPQGIPIDPRPLGCHTHPEQNRTAGQRDLYLSGRMVNGVHGTENTSRDYYLALLVDDYDNNPLTEPTSPTLVCGDERQHYFFGVGYRSEALSVLHCMPYVEALWVTATFVLPELSIATDIPLTPDRDSSIFLSHSASMTAFQNRNWVDILVAVVNGSSGIGQVTGSFSGPDSNYTSRLISAVESTLAEYFAQYLHLNYRQPVENNINNSSASSLGQNLLTPDGRPATGTVTDRTRLRLIQNPVSTRILQGLLGVMGVCLTASTVLGRGARVIPRDPGSVASKMAYFTGGEVWRRVPVGADRWTDEQIKKHGLGMSGETLLLGWWGGDDREESEDGTRGKKFAVDSTDRKDVA